MFKFGVWKRENAELWLRDKSVNPWWFMVYGTVGQSNVKLHIPGQDESHTFIK